MTWDPVASESQGAMDTTVLFAKQTLGLKTAIR